MTFFSPLSGGGGLRLKEEVNRTTSRPYPWNDKEGLSSALLYVLHVQWTRFCDGGGGVLRWHSIAAQLY